LGNCDIQLRSLRLNNRTLAFWQSYHPLHSVLHLVSCNDQLIVLLREHTMIIDDRSATVEFLWIPEHLLDSCNCFTNNWILRHIKSSQLFHSIFIWCNNRQLFLKVVHLMFQIIQINLCDVFRPFRCMWDLWECTTQLIEYYG
jgi:hypothetical protein